MQQQTFSTLTLSKFDLLSNYKEINHFISERSGGVSTGEIGALNLSFRAGDEAENVKENRRRLAKAMGIAPSQLIFPSQTHSNHVQVVHAGTQPEQLTETDALITHTPGICICVMSADCVPILLYDPIAKAVGAIHAGWRGTVGKILTFTVQAMQQHFGTQPSNLIAGIGPSICPQVYEVGTEVITAVEQAFDHPDLITRKNSLGKGYFNLWEANRIQLSQLGVPADAIEVAGVCTYTESDRFFSARKSGNKAGRFAAGIMLNTNDL